MPSCWSRPKASHWVQSSTILPLRKVETEIPSANLSEGRGWAIHAEEAALPDGSGLPPRRRIGHPIEVEERPYETGRLRGEGVGGEECQHVRRAFEQPPDEAVEPGRRVGGEGREPELPVEPRLVGSHPPERPARVSWFERE